MARGKRIRGNGRSLSILSSTQIHTLNNITYHRMQDLMKHTILIVWVLMLFASASYTHTQTLKLGAPFSDHMVIQADLPVVVWGWDKPGSSISVTLAGQSAETSCQPDGRWLVDLPAVSDVGPHELRVIGSGTLTLTDVLAGDVWWCSGQSNMAWPIGKSSSREQVMSGPPDPQLRLLRLPAAGADQAATDIDATWQPARGEALQTFSGVAYHFVQRRGETPVGRSV